MTPAMRTYSLSSLRALLLLLGSTVVLSGCGDKINRLVGLVRDAPDEFQVTTRAPLSMPTNFDLPPPTPGAPRPQELSERRQAEEALVPTLALENPQTAGPTPGQEALIAAAGPAAPADIRATVAAEAAQPRDDRTALQRLLFWQNPPQQGVIVDPEREAKRLRENAALGQDSRAGVTPVEQPKRKSLWDSIF
jgi:hypothetical protein